MESKQADTATQPTTLGDVLYAGGRPDVPESGWVDLVRRVAVREAAALHGLYERAHRPVFTLALRLTCNREIAEEVTLETFLELQRQAAKYDAAGGSVLAWIMNLARRCAIERLRANQRKNRIDGGVQDALVAIDMPDYRHILDLRARTQALAAALATLTSAERAAIERVYFSREPAAGLISEIHSGLRKLVSALAQAGEVRSPEAENQCPRSPFACLHALGALGPTKVAEVETHFFSCTSCRWEARAFRNVIAAFVGWPTDLLRPSDSVQGRVVPGFATQREWREPEWAGVAPGIWCKILAADPQSHCVSMLVRLGPGGAYPPHTHAAVEELHLLAGELWIDERKLHPGDYNRAEPGTKDRRVYSETGCTCVLATSSRDVLS